MITISTKQGDKGTTSLYGGKRVPKHHPLIMVNGTIDELQVSIGELKVLLTNPQLKKEATNLQYFLYQVMSEIAGGQVIEEKIINQWLNTIENKQIEKQQQTIVNNRFVLPGDNELEIKAHSLRVKTRACERLMCQESNIHPQLTRFIPFFNRLSDYFFILSQYFLQDQ